MSETLSSAQLETVDRILATARSVRRRLDFERAIEPAILLECIDVATQAPSGAGGEAWRFLVVTSAQKKARLAALYREVLEEFAAQRGLTIKASQRALVDRLHEIPAMVLVCATHPPPEGVAGQVAYYGSVLPAAWSLMLALRAREIGATWTTLLASRQNEVSGLLDLPAQATLLVMLPVGHMKNARLRKADRQPAGTVTFWEHWGQCR